MRGDRDQLRAALEAQLSFTGLGDANPEDSRDLWAVIEPEIEGILQDFYGHLQQHSSKSDFKRINVERLIAKQKEHWGRLFSGTFSADYVDGVLKVGTVHNSIGLEPEWYVGGYSYLLNQMAALVMDHFKGEPERVLLLNNLVTLDMGIALSVYQPDWD